MIKTKSLIILITIILCSSVILIAHFQFFDAREHTLQLYSEKQIVLAKQVGLAIENLFNERITAIELIAEKPEIQKPKNHKYRQEFEHIFNKMGYYKYIIFFDKNANVKNYYPEKSDINFIQNLFDKQHMIDYSKKLKNKKESIICEYSIIHLKKDYICIRVPVYNTGDKLSGIILAVIDLKKSLKSVINPVISQQDVHAFILSQNGMVLYHPSHPEMVQNSIYDKSGKCFKCHINFKIEKKMLENEFGWAEKTENENDKKLLSYAKINLPGVSWSLGIDMPYRIITEVNSKQFLMFFLLSASIILVVIVGSFALFRINKEKLEIEKESSFFKAKTKLLENIEEAEAKYRALVEQSPDAIAIYQKGKFEFTNEKFISLFGYSIEELNTKEISFYNLVPSESSTSLKKEIQTFILHRKKIARFDTHGKTKNGKILELKISIERFSFRRKIAYQIVIHDVTELKMKEKENIQREHLAFIGEMSARIAHEIKNPLASLQAGIQLLESSISPDKNGKEYFNRLTGEVQRVDRIVKGLLSYAKEEQISKKPNDIKQMILKVVELIKPTFKTKKIEWKLNLDSINNLLNIDEQKIEQVLWNLLINSGQAIKDEGIVEVQLKNTDNNYVQIDISDNGIGIPKENLANIFKPFFSTKSQGSGLGLSICKKILIAHNGDIEIVKNDNLKTTIRVLLPGNKR